MTTEVTAVIAEGDYVAVRWIVSADHTAPFAGIPATGRRVSFDGMVLYRLRDGRIAETWLHPNQTALLGAIGALPQAA
jgi:predicted ester cyclase